MLFNTIRSWWLSNRAQSGYANKVPSQQLWHKSTSQAGADNEEPRQLMALSDPREGIHG